ncbi:AraC family transcriptional regulator [Nocardioides albertanoniae]|uniref:AraC family transcriptional regulator n=1 Tax=Nocardioides albertanoniae TaxID=1175486 RepID=A0A543A3A4_9ACTN|nr:AraC family transcriptional regulator [Nocardioides albertanoniae]TQL67065.1 AraC family transcriptional regulator [Nocardioides albertanoniae]
MPRPLLGRHNLIATTDVDQAREAVAERFCSHYLALTKAGSQLDMVHNAAPLGDDVMLNYMRYGDEVRITPGTFDDFYLIQLPLAGTAKVKVGEQVVLADRTRASIGSPTEAVDMLWSDGCEKLQVYIRRSAVEEAAAGLGSSGPVVFDPTLDLGRPEVRDWLKMVRLAYDNVEAGGSLMSSPLVAAPYEQALIGGLLTVQANTSLEIAPEHASSSISRAVRMAVDLLEAQPDRAWKVAELAKAVGVSPRTLQEGFQRDLGTTPLEYWRRARLERAYADLLAADASAVSVTEVAAQWGFFHLGRFSQAYRAQFGELPSQTLMR